MIRVVEMGEINGCVQMVRRLFNDTEVDYRVQQCILVANRRITGNMCSSNIFVGLSWPVGLMTNVYKTE